MSIDINTIRTDLTEALLNKNGKLTINKGDGITQAMLRELRAVNPDKYRLRTEDVKKGLFQLAQEIASSQGLSNIERVEIGQEFDIKTLSAKEDLTNRTGTLAQPGGTASGGGSAAIDNPLKTDMRVEDSGLQTKALKTVGRMVETVIPSAQAAQARPIANSVPESSDVFSSAESIISKDGNYYLVGPNGATKTLTFAQVKVKLNIPDNAPENLKNSHTLANDIALLIDAFSLKYHDHPQKREAALKELDKLYSTEDVKLGRREVTPKEIVGIVRELVFTGDEAAQLVGADGKGIFTGDSGYRRVKLLEFIRKEWGQYDFVAQSILSNPKNKFGFPDDEAILKNKDSLSSLGGVQMVQKVRETIRKAKADAQQNWSNEHKKYMQVFTTQNPGASIDENIAEDWYVKLVVLERAKREIAYQTLYNKNLNGADDAEKKILQNILGATTFTISDRAADISGQVGEAIMWEALAIGAGLVTAGAGTYLVNAAYAARIAGKSITYAERIKQAKDAHGWGLTASRIIAGGAGFELGHANAVSLHERGEFTAGTREGYIQSIALAGVMRGISRVIDKTALKIDPADSLGKNALKFSGQVTLEASAIFGTTGLLKSTHLKDAEGNWSLTFDGRDNWNLEELAQAFMMSLLFRGGSMGFQKYLASKSEGGIKVTKESKPAPERTVASLEYISNDGTRYYVKGSRWEISNDGGVTRRPISKKDVPDAIRDQYSQLIKDNKNLSEPERFKKVAEIIKKDELTPLQQDKLRRAHESHNDGKPGDGVKKLQILMEDGAFTREQAVVLVREGYSGKPHGSATGGGQGENNSKEKYFYNEKTYKSQIRTAINGLKNEGDSFPMGDFVITKEGRTFRIKGPIDEFVVQTQKDLISRLERYLRRDIKAANEFIDSRVKAHVDSLPAGKKLKYGDHTIQKKNTGEVEVVSKDGRVLTGEDLNAFYQEYAEKLLNARMQSFLSKYGDTKFDPKILQEWYGKDRRFYNPVTWAKGAVSMTKGAVSMTWNEIMQPVQTWNAFLGKGGALRTLDNPLIMLNNITKAIVLRDVKMNWFSTDSAMRLAGRGTILTGATIAAGNVTIGPNLLTQLGMAPHVIGYGYVTGSTETSTEEFNKTAFSNYYCGMIWGYIIQQMIGGMSDN